MSIDPSARVHATADVEDGVAIGPGTAVWDHVHVRGPGTSIGRDCIVGEKTYLAYGVAIGDRVKLYQGVTLGAASVRKELANLKRHPTVGDDVVIYANATILGGDTVIGARSVVGGNVWLTRSVPPGSQITQASLQASQATFPDTRS